MRWWVKAGLLAASLTGIMLLCVGLGVGSLLLRNRVTPQNVELSNSEEVAIADDGALNRLVVVGGDGNVVTMDPDGQNITPLTSDASAALTYLYPTWSPDGSTVAFVEVAVAGERPGASALHIAAPDGSETRRVPTEFPPFYLFWSPTSETLAFLSSWASGMALRMVDVAEGATAARTVQEGQPFYFSWEPEGQSLFAHIGDNDLTFLDTGGNRSPLELSGGRFQAPHWSDDGERLAFVTDADNNQNTLNISGPDGEDVRALATEHGNFSFNWSADNRRLAYSFSTREVGLAAFGPLWVRDVDANQSWELSKEPVVAFFWSPDGQSIAFLRPEPHDPVQRAPEAAPLRQGGQLWLRWHIWNGERTYPLDIFVPSDEFLLNYVRYFDQYAQSVSLWSPDSTQLLYSGLSEGGLQGIWTLPIAEESTATRISQGTLAAWSPR